MELKVLNVYPRKESQFNKKGIFTVEDLLEFFPRRYEDYSRETGIDLNADISYFTAICDSVNFVERYKTYIYANCRAMYNGKIIHLAALVFNPYKFDWLNNFDGKEIYIAGKVTYNENYDDYSVFPKMICLNTPDRLRIAPVYPSIAGMAESYFKERLISAFKFPELLEDKIPQEYVDKAGVINYKDALVHLHFPKSFEDVENGRRRIYFNDLLYFALQNELTQESAATSSSYVITKSDAAEKLKQLLPYELTEDQKTVVDALMETAASGRRINALVQGDVGCGKTIVATLMMVAAADNGYQSVLMAPTQILARQHYDDISAMVEQLGIKVAYLGNELKTKEKNAALEMIASGEANIIVGTHSVIGKDVTFSNLALTVVDEEHRFGVMQRAAIVQKAAEGVHNITMSATPIPRSLAFTIYGGAIQPYTITTMPPGRKPVITGIASSQEKLFKFIIKEVKKGHQLYVVCPMVDPSEKVLGVKSVDEVYAEYKEVLSSHGIRIGTLTGKDTKKKTTEVMSGFKNGEIDILIATTVVEVGVNVPNATLMVVSNAERFGLATLHQLRGRVGRSNLQAYCVLDARNCSEKGLQRLNVMCSTNDGFKVAEEDLKIRGAGELLGTKQSGENKYITLMLAYPAEYVKAQEIAKEMLSNNVDCRMLRDVRADIRNNYEFREVNNERINKNT